MFTEWAPAQTPSPAAKLAGVYEAIPNGLSLPGGRKNTGSPEEIELLPAIAEQMKTVNPKDDPYKTCQPIGPFRMMAREGTKIEIFPTNDAIHMFFEDTSHGGLVRNIYLKRNHPEKPPLLWLGDSIGHWEGETLVIDTVGFNNRTWLSDKGAQHSEFLHLVERIRPILDNKYLEYRVTADDRKALAKPYTYTRYYQKTKDEILDDFCEDEN
jgi:hypothetical protein